MIRHPCGMSNLPLPSPSLQAQDSRSQFYQFYDRDKRHMVKLYARATQRNVGLEFTVMVTNISRGGCRIESLARLHEEHPLLLSIAGMPPLHARIKWSKTGACGCKFAAPLDGPVLCNLVRGDMPPPPA